MRDREIIAKFLVVTFFCSWLIWLAIIFFKIEGIYKNVLMVAGTVGPAVGAYAISYPAQKKESLKWKVVVGALLVFGISYLLRILRPALIENEFSVQNFLHQPAAVLIVLLNVALLAVLVAKRTDLSFKKQDIKHYLVGLLFFPFAILIVNILSKTIGIPTSYASTELGSLSFSGKAVILSFSALYFILLAGGIEELGWRGALLPLLQTSKSPLGSSFITGIFWATWHLPLFFIKGDGITVMGLLARFGVSIILSILLTWFYNKSNRSTLQAILLHGMSNVCITFLPSHGLLWFAVLLLFAIFCIVQGKMWRRPTIAAMSDRLVPSNSSLAVAETGARQSMA